MALAPALEASLGPVGRVLAFAREPWWIIGSAAVALHAAKSVEAVDVDVLIGLEDASQLFPALGLPVRPGAADPRFRSDLFATWRANSLPVEFMAGFALQEAGRFRRIQLLTREVAEVGGHVCYFPGRDELKRLLERFGRPKDLAHAALL